MIYFFAPKEHEDYLKDYNIFFPEVYKPIESLNFDDNNFKEFDTIIFTVSKSPFAKFNLYGLNTQLNNLFKSSGIIFYNPKVKDIKGNIIFDGNKPNISYPLIEQPKVIEEEYNVILTNYIPTLFLGAVILEPDLYSYLKKRKQYGFLGMLLKYLKKNGYKKLFNGKDLVVVRNLDVINHYKEKELKILYGIKTEITSSNEMIKEEVK